MTYCCGILVRDGLVMIADTRTNAGLDNVSTFRKLHIFSKPGERIMAIASAGNLAISQSVLSTLTEGIEDPTTGEVETLMNAPTMFQAAQRIGRAIRLVHATEGPALRSEDVSFDVSFLFGGQIQGSRMRLFMIYTAGNFIECTTDAHARVAIGLDYLGAAPVRGTRYGGGTETLTVSVRVDRAGRSGQWQSQQ